jgi:hypothetical protein
MVLQAIICADVFLGTFHDRVFGSLSHSVSAENHPLLPQPEMGQPQIWQLTIKIGHQLLLPSPPRKGQ